MAIRTFRPYTPGTRTRVVTDFSEVTAVTSLKSVTTRVRVPGV